MTKRRWLVASDMHGSLRKWEAIYEAASHDPTITAIILCGDLTNYGKRQASFSPIEETYAEFVRAQDFIERLAKLKPVYFITGNHDWDVDGADFPFRNSTFIQRITVTIDGLKVHGINQSPCFNFPQFAIEWTNMSEFPEVDKKAFDFEKVDIVVSHCPPLGVLDRVGRDLAGSPALRQYILDKSPRYVFCGHVHEDGGKVEVLGKTLVANLAATCNIFDI